MAFLAGANNAVLINNCQNLSNLTVQLQVTEDLITLEDTGFSVQLNCYPQIGAITPNSTQGTTFPGEVVGQLEWFQYVLIIGNNSASFEIQYWAHAKSFQDAGPGGNPPEIRWPPGYTPNPLNTSPWLPVFPGTAVTGSVGSVSSNRIPAGSTITIALATDSNGNVTGATFSIADPNGNVQSGSTKPWSDYAGQTEPPEYALFPIYGFQLNVSSAPGLPVMFTSGAGTLTYSVSSGTLSVQTANTCGGIQPGTAENSNVVYQAVTPASGSTVSQSFAAPAMGMNFYFDKSTFGQDEVTQTSTWGLAYWLAISGLWRQWLGFKAAVRSQRAAQSRPDNHGGDQRRIKSRPHRSPDRDDRQQPAGGQHVRTAAGSGDRRHARRQFSDLLLPLHHLLPEPQRLQRAQSASGRHCDPDGELDRANPDRPARTTPPLPFTLTAGANIELAKGEDPFFVNLNPTSPQAFPSWLSFDLRLFKVTADPGPSDVQRGESDDRGPAAANGPIAYIQAVLNHLNNPSLITNGDTFDSALAQDEEFVGARVFAHEQCGPARVQFRGGARAAHLRHHDHGRSGARLLPSASTLRARTRPSPRWERGRGPTAGARTERPDTRSRFSASNGLSLLAVPCFATERVNLNQPADMKTQTDPPNVQMITTVPGQEVDSYFGCWLDVNQTTPFMILIPPFLQSAWDGPWTGTESLSAAIAVAPHQCLVAEIRFDDTPVPNGAASSTSDKLAQRNIAWLDGPQ